MNIQIMKIFKESFSDVRSLKWEWLRVGSGPILILALGIIVVVFYYTFNKSFYEAGGSPFDVNAGTLGITSFFILSHVAFVIALFIGLIGFQINGYRYAVLREGAGRWITLNLNMRFVKIFFYSFIYNSLFNTYGVTSGYIVSLTDIFFDNIVLNVILGILLGLLGFYVLFRTLLYPVAISIDQPQALRTSWKLLKGNVLRFMGLLLLIGLTIVLFGLVGGIVIGLLNGLFFWGGQMLGSLSLVLWVPFLIFMLLLFWAVYSQAMGLVYQDLSRQKLPSTELP